MSDYETIRVVGADRDSWNPSAGRLAHAVVQRKLAGDTAAQQSTLLKSQQILQKCSPSPDSDGPVAGLVVGHVQSGKTLSFTAVAAMAADNEYRVVIVIAGTTKELANQSQERLAEDLGIEESPISNWYHIHNPEEADAERIADVLSEWESDSVPPKFRKTVLITVLKNHKRLENLYLVLERIEARIEHAPTLIIDDEADQASLNTLVKKNELSTTYLNINLVRMLFQNHTFLQYTATPQAVLLINLIDLLSPDFVEVLQPGGDYVGGDEFFADGGRLVETIPPADIPSSANAVLEPPESLEHALQLFFLGVASGFAREDFKPRNRSMMIHPSKGTVDHTQFHAWVLSIKRLWADTLDLAQSDAARIELEAEFRRAHADLSRTVGDLEPFEELQPFMKMSISGTELRLVNSLKQANREIKWKRNYSWILVGGQVLDRGFTIEGLTVTYMPRGPGVWNADTIQQRARFFGYKRQYLGFCRVFLEADVIGAYRSYVGHERDVRARLVTHAGTGESLRDLRRAFLLDRQLRPTRANIIDVDYARPLFVNGWCIMNSPHKADVGANHSLVSRFIDSNRGAFEPDDGHQKRRPDHRHRIAQLRLADVYREMLVEYRVVDAEDSRKMTAALVMLDAWLDERPDEYCSVVQMRPDFRARRQVRDGKIVRLLQGADRNRAVYPGDRAIRDTNVTIQIHTVALLDGPVLDDSTRTTHESVSIPVLWLADEVLRDVLVQDQ